MVTIKCNLLLKDKTLQALQEDFAAQVGTGVLLLPMFCELVSALPPYDSIKVITKEED